jgi:hypothetical protein
MDVTGTLSAGKHKNACKLAFMAIWVVPRNLSLSSLSFWDEGFFIFT